MIFLLRTAIASAAITLAFAIDSAASEPLPKRAIAAASSWLDERATQHSDKIFIYQNVTAVDCDRQPGRTVVCDLRFAVRRSDSCSVTGTIADGAIVTDCAANLGLELPLRGCLVIHAAGRRLKTRYQPFARLIR